ncbi:MAG: hypothetical protein FWF76_01440 [Oscillospiraceae bacterium]|nr:hypothetical protein [Oscillospiraceae bacterium]
MLKKTLKYPPFIISAMLFVCTLVLFLSTGVIRTHENRFEEFCFDDFVRWEHGLNLIEARNFLEGECPIVMFEDYTIEEIIKLVKQYSKTGKLPPMGAYGIFPRSTNYILNERKVIIDSNSAKIFAHTVFNSVFECYRSRSFRSLGVGYDADKEMWYVYTKSPIWSEGRSYSMIFRAANAEILFISGWM